MDRSSKSRTKPTGFLRKGEVSSVIARQRIEQQRGRIEEVLSSLPEAERQLYRANPHLQQVAACPVPLQRKPVFTERDRILDLTTASRFVYHRRTDEIKTVVHSGQRKLLVTEIEFLSRFCQPNDAVVYAGAAGGSHQTILASMFPSLLFVLYDPNSFSVLPTEKREIHESFFTNQTAQELSSRFEREGRRILFLSDVRRVDRELPELEQQKLILNDLQEQRIWLEIIRPVASLLKFVMPYPVPGIPDQVDYLDGMIFTQPWVGATSTETRLLVLDYRTVKSYDIRQYEEALAYYNQFTRTTYYETIDGVPSEWIGCHCYDCVAELFILVDYARRHMPNLDIPQLVKTFDATYQ